MTTTGSSSATPGTTRGVVYVHAVPAALCPHVAWALAGVLGVPVDPAWTPQPTAPGTWRTEVTWQGRPGLSAGITSALRACGQIRFEVTEDPGAGAEGARYAFTPTLGVFHALTGAHGDVLVPEDRLRTAVVTAAATGIPLEQELARLLGKPWDDELEPFRWAGDGAPVRWLHQVV